MNFLNKMPVLLQRNNYECGIACIAMLISKQEGQKIETRKLKGSKEHIGREGTDLQYLKGLSESVGYTFKAYKVPKLPEQVLEGYLQSPLMVHWDYNHFIVVEMVQDTHITIIDPAKGRRKISSEEFYAHYSGVAVSLRKQNKQGYSLTHLTSKSAIGRLGKYLSKEKKLLVYIILLSFLFQGLNLIAPFFTQYVIDTFMQSEQGNMNLKTLALLAGIVTIVFFGLSIVRMFWIIKLQVHINKRLTHQFVRKVFSLPMKFFEINSSGDIATRINNIAVIREIVSRLASTLILDISLLVVFSGVMLFYSPLLSVLVFAGAAIQVVCTMYLLPKIEVFTKQEVNSQASFQSQLVEILRSMTFVKTVGNTDSVEQELNGVFNDQIDHFSKKMKISSVLGGVSNSINLSLPLLVIIFGVAIGMQSGMTIGAVVAFSTIAGRFMSPLGSIIGSLESIKMVEEMMDRIESVLEEEDEILNQENGAQFDPARDRIELDQVHFGYDSKEDILQGIQLTVHPKDHICLIGRTGSGKSTLFKLIAGLYKPTQGSIRIGNHSLDQMNLVQLRDNIGYIVQDVSLFNDTILNNIKYFNESVSDQDAIQAAKDACIHDDILQFPMGYHTIVGENGISLSGGQRQRISIARVLAKKPSLLLIDEGTSNLDQKTEQEVLSNLRRRDMTVISITHRTSSFKEYESVYELKGGSLHLVETQHPSNLAATN
ncbi:peptidase domain-containing ABC transporter [Pontibacillus salicampi]|uniref:Peptidase domain-containing ABC transporter n=1 Tax=Pontibacillus salicampi TaxID=1449801 RepID=A0ABV6LMS4_9BACI